MSERIFVGVAWPYANGSLHVGQIAGAYLPADIFARYHRLRGNEVLMVSGSDQHGTPITIKAEQEGKTPAEIADNYYREFCQSWEGLGISFDLFTTTGTDNHAAVAQDIFLTLQKNGHIYKDTVSQPYCSQCQRFLPDRYIEGTCPYCQFVGTRGDQCDRCGKPLNTTELREPRCRICGTPPEFKDSEHFFLKLSNFQEKLEQWVGEQGQWRPNVLGLTQRYLQEGLRDRAITRDIEWGVPVPVEGFEGKRLYVWFEAVIGYLSASKQWAREIAGDAERWRHFWGDGARGYYFIGKDNIPFHTLIWPAMLMGYGGLNLPYDVPANEFLTIEGRKLSTSQNWAVWVPDYLSRYAPDPLRYLLAVKMPETGDSDFSWREFVQRNNDELVATYGNLVNRVLTFTYRNFEGRVPAYSDMGADNAAPFDDRDKDLLEKAESAYKDIHAEGGLLATCRFKQAIMAAMAVAQEANRYLEEKAPWKVIKEDRAAAAISLYAVICAIALLKNTFYPFLPFSSQQVHEYLGFEGHIEEYARKNPLQPLPPPGQPLREPKPLFAKLDESVIEEEGKRIGA
jgi:methionyl-tRNA synthetase